MDVVGMCHSLFWLKSKEVARRTRPPVFSVVSIVPIRRWRSAAEEMVGARAVCAGSLTTVFRTQFFEVSCKNLST